MSNLVEVAKRGDALELKALLGLGWNANFASSGTPALVAAAANGSLPCVRFLVEAGAKLDGADAEGFTPAMWAAFMGHGECLREFAKLGADLNAQSRAGWTAAIRAAQAGKIDGLLILAEGGCDLAAVNDYGMTALDWAKRCKRVDCEKFLIGVVEAAREREAIASVVHVPLEAKKSNPTRI